MSRKRKEQASAAAAPWLLLIHQLPPKPAYPRVKIWRRLQGLGAVSVKNSVYVLPAGEQALEDFQWLLREIEQGGGDGLVCEAHLVDGLGDQEVRALFDAARDADYEVLAAELRALAAASEGSTKAEMRPDATSQLRRLRRRFAEIVAVDFFGATGRLIVEALISSLEARFADDERPAAGEGARAPRRAEDLLGRTWVTRRGVHVDRIACAWLIRRFVDAKAKFKFVSGRDYGPEDGELRFDMVKAEFTHEGDMCSFEVMIDRLGLSDPALRAIAEIIHDIDLKDAKFGREETAGIAHVIDGIVMAQKDDLARIERGSAVFDDMYAYFRKKRGR